MDSEIADFDFRPANTVENPGLVGGKLVLDVPEEQLRPEDTINLDGIGKRRITIGTNLGVKGIDLAVKAKGVESGQKPMLVLEGREVREAKTGVGKLVPGSKGPLVETGVRAIDPNWQEIQKNQAQPVVWVNGAPISTKDGVRLENDAVLAFGADIGTATRYVIKGAVVKIG